jgi:rhodanese-related sulfurtransferase
MIKEINPVEAQKILLEQNDAVLIDVRSTMEYEFVGHPPMAMHIPIKEWPIWETDAGFVEKVKKALNNEKLDNPLLMLCRSGARSALAGEMLANEGYTNVYNVLEGFEGDKDENGHRNTINGWRFHGLPWEQS